LKSIEDTNYRILMTKGEVHVERKKKLEDMSAAFKKLQTNAEQLADLLDEDVPPYQDDDPGVAEDDPGVTEVNEDTSEDGLGSPWEDDDTKSFYEILLDLQEIVPAILYKDSKGQEQPVLEDVGEAEDETAQDDQDDEDEQLEPPLVDGT
jgi:regulator of nonsense transcripts 2